MGNSAPPADLIGRYGATESGYADSLPRTVTLANAFHMMRCPVTNALFAEFTAARLATGDPYLTAAERRGEAWVMAGERWKWVAGACWRHPKGPASTVDDKADHPVTCVTWEDADAFAEWLTRQQDHDAAGDGKVFRLPAEAEWEFACRAGRQGAYWWGDDLGDQHAIHSVGGPQRLHPEPVEQDPVAGRGRCNRWRLSDMSGNVWEWCQDSYLAGDPSRKVVRGGSWGSSSAAGRMLSGFRGQIPADNLGDRNGFRLVYASPPRASSVAADLPDDRLGVVRDAR